MAGPDTELLELIITDRASSCTMQRFPSTFRAEPVLLYRGSAYPTARS